MALQALAGQGVHPNQSTGYYAPKNFNFWYFFGFIALVVLVMQLFTGIFLTMFYKPGEATAFDSVEFIMREVDFGWLIRYLHSTGASAFFVVIYLHMFRALMYGSYKRTARTAVAVRHAGLSGADGRGVHGLRAALGQHVLLGGAGDRQHLRHHPGHRAGLVEWIRGDYGIADATLNRFFALHVVAVPLALLLLVVLHLVALRRTGSNNPDGIEIKANLGADGHPLDGIPFHPYYTVKDSFGIGVFLVIFAVVVFFVPTLGGMLLEHANFEPANAFSTPIRDHTLVVLHALLRDPARHPDQRLGALLLLSLIVVSLFLPWLDRSPVKSIRYKGTLSELSWRCSPLLPGSHVSGPASRRSEFRVDRAPVHDRRTSPSSS